MNQIKWFIHPILLFLFSIMAVALSLILYIYWYVEVSEGLKAVIKKANLDPSQALASQTWVVIMVLSILVGIIIVGIFTIFIYNQKILQLYQLQRNFINNFTHELKTPVTSLKLYLQTFDKYELSREDQQKYLAYMLHDANRLSSNINHILSLARIESKTFKGDFAFKNMVETIDNFVKTNIHLFNDCDIQVVKPKDSFVYRIDHSLFEMLLMNLITNAIAYNDSENPRVVIEFESKRKEFQVRFIDNGIGLPPAEMKRIFRKFYRVGRTNRGAANGSGLGLYLAASIVRFHKGKIRAENNEGGKGAVFIITFPLKSLEQSDE